jgi:octaprenyl-diphosphate synthase
MLDYQKEAFDILHQFEPGEARTGLEELVLYTTERKK